MVRRAQSGHDRQLSLWQSVAECYLAAGDREIPNEEMYTAACAGAGVDRLAFDAKSPVGRSGSMHAPMARSARWAQQTLKVRNVIQRVPNKRGVWRLTEAAKTKLRRVERGFLILGFSTKLGLAVWGDCRDGIAALDEEIHLVLTSPPFAISRPRAYGAIAPQEYVDFICSVIEPIMPKLARGASLAINLTNDVFRSGSPARDTVNERLLISLEDRFGLRLMDRLVWHNKSKAPGPVAWASIKRTHLNSGFEPILWLCADAGACFADNRRVLQPHTDRHRHLIERGGERRSGSYSDGRYTVKPGSFANRTHGRIPRNVLEFSHSCGGQRAYKRRAAALGLPVHGAPWPEALVEFLIKYLTEPGMLTVDLFAGSQTTPRVAERLNRRWLSFDTHLEYVVGGATRFDDKWVNPDLLTVLGLSADADGISFANEARGDGRAEPRA